VIDRTTVLEKMHDYIQNETKDGSQARYITRHMMGLFHGQPMASSWRKKFAAGEYAL
jgi:tRNA-dihydrouridine synthase A